MARLIGAASKAHAPATTPRPALRLPPLPTIGQVIHLYKLSAKQKLSQNFLLDLNITDRMVRAAGPVTDAALIEVGSGPGSLTRSCLLAGANHVIAVEKDPRFVPALKQLQEASDGRLIPALGDALLIDEAKLLKHVNAVAVPWEESETRVKLVGNLPFAISTPLLLKWLRLIDRRQGPFAYGRAPMVLTFQAEVADRLVATPGTKEFGRLSVMVQQLCDVRAAFTIFGKSFVPPPDVDARVVFIQPRVEPVAPLLSYRTLEYVLREVMSLRRKQISNSIERLGEGATELLEMAELKPSVRPEDVTVAEWVRLANAYHTWPKRSIPADFLPKRTIPRNYTSQALKLLHMGVSTVQKPEEKQDEELEGVEAQTPTIHFPVRARPQDELAQDVLPGDGEVVVRRIFSPDVRRIVAPKEVEQKKEAKPKKAGDNADAKEKTEQRVGLKRKELRKVVKPLQPGSPSKMLPSPTKVKAQMAREHEEAREETERVARNEGQTFAKFSDRFEEEHEKIRRKAKDRKLAIAKAKRTRVHRGLLRTSKGSL